ncbi:MAG TPA: methyltransferase domain-containing protein [Candidatus Angelobacter sp.]|jgi:S-adenosylmethionine-dependent methyltransferase
MKTTVKGENCFESDASKYAAYLETPEGRLRGDLTFANLQDFLPVPPGIKSLCVLDLGCGTGTAAVRLARLGFHVTLLDSSQAMLEIAQRAALDADVSNQVTVQYGDATTLSSLFKVRSFDVILCHNLLEYVDDPGAVLAGAAGLLRDSSAILSVLVRSQAGAVLKAAIQTGDLAAAEEALTSEWAQESLYGGKVRLFTSDKMRDMMKASSLRVIAERGVRIIADYLPPKVSRDEEYERILELERKLGRRPEFAASARYAHFLARVLAR